MEHYFTNNQDLKSEVKELKYSYAPFSFTFLSDNGVFSKKYLDYGSKSLLETYLELEKEPLYVLDVGCGYGFIGTVISIVNKSIVDMIDVNKRALHLAKRNTKKTEYMGNIFESDAYTNVNNKYDIIITNPPIRAGKSKVLEILLGAKEHLKKNGKLYYVIRKDQGALGIEKLLKDEYDVSLIKRDKGYFIYSAKLK